MSGVRRCSSLAMQYGCSLEGVLHASRKASACTVHATCNYFVYNPPTTPSCSEAYVSPHPATIHCTLLGVNQNKLYRHICQMLDRAHTPQDRQCRSHGSKPGPPNTRCVRDPVRSALSAHAMHRTRSAASGGRPPPTQHETATGSCSMHQGGPLVMLLPSRTRHQDAKSAKRETCTRRNLTHTVQAKAPPVRPQPVTQQASVAVLPSSSLLAVKKNTPHPCDHQGPRPQPRRQSVD